MDKAQERELPFFARFLEGQFPETKTDVRAGKGKPGGGFKPPPVVTLKYPSDDDDDPPVVSI